MLTVTLYGDDYEHEHEKAQLGLEKSVKDEVKRLFDLGTIISVKLNLSLKTRINSFVPQIKSFVPQNRSFLPQIGSFFTPNKITYSYFLGF